MDIVILIISVTAIVAILVFALMRNKEAKRNSERRGKLEQRKREFIGLLNNTDSQTGKTSENDN